MSKSHDEILAERAARSLKQQQDRTAEADRIKAHREAEEASRKAKFNKPEKPG